MSARTGVAVEVRYRKLADHCHGCPECKTDTTRACPEAARLRHAWSKARRGVTA